MMKIEPLEPLWMPFCHQNAAENPAFCRAQNRFPRLIASEDAQTGNIAIGPERTTWNANPEKTFFHGKMYRFLSMEKRGKVDFIPFEDGSQHVHHVFSIKMSRSPSCSNQHMCFHGKSPNNGAFKGKNHRNEIAIFQQAMVAYIHPANHKKLGIKPLRIEIQYELTILFAD